MSLFGTRFGKKEEPVKSVPDRASSSAPPAAPASPKEESVRVVDTQGQEHFITRDQYRTNVLVGGLRKSWNNPDALYKLIVGAVRDGFGAEVVEACEHLYRTDSNPHRAACLWGLALMGDHRMVEAEKVYQTCLATHGDEVFVLTNLAKLHSARKDDFKAEEILWRALELDPNQHSGVHWYHSMYKERQGTEGGLKALERIAGIPGSWRPQLWLARASLRRGQLEVAKAYYRESLSRAGRPVPRDVIFQVSGDLGQSGQPAAILELAAPHFDPDLHGVEVAANLIKAHYDLGRRAEAGRLVNDLSARDQPEWRETLKYWDGAIRQARGGG